MKKSKVIYGDDGLPIGVMREEFDLELECPVIEQYTTKCECGAVCVDSPMHSFWCPAYESIV